MTYCPVVISALTLTGCIKDEECRNSEENIIEIRPVIAGGRITGNYFDSGDQIGLYGAVSPGVPSQDNYANNIPYTFDGTRWTAPGGSPLPWPGLANLDFYAYWPYDTALSTDNPLSYPFTVNSDQTTEEKYQLNDFLWARATGQPPGETVPLLFSHRMTRVKINIVSSFDVGEGWPAQAEIALVGLSANTTINLEDGSVKTDITSGGSVLANAPEREESGIIIPSGSPMPRSEEDIFPLLLDTPAEGYDISLAAIITPQAIQGDSPLVRITLNGDEYVFIPDNDFSFISGETLTLNLTLIEDWKPKGVRAEQGILAVDDNGELNLDGRGYIVYFRWGSAVAVFGRENGYVFEGKEDIAWIPPGFDIGSITGTGVEAWDKINYATAVSVYPDRTNSADVAKGLGDPCEFAIKDGQVGNYRIAKGNPYEQYTDGGYVADYNGIAGRWSNYGNPQSQFYPFTGNIYDGRTRITNTGYFWANAVYSADSGYNLSITNTGYNQSSQLWRGYGMAVRCVRKTP